MLEITEDQRKEILAYLARRPYVEVASLIGMIASLKKKENKKNDGVTPKKQ
jgi:hypothetical protein